MKKQQVISILLFTVLSSTIESTSAKEIGDGWDYEVTPYLWAAGLDGNFATGGVSSPVNNDYEFFVLKNLDAVASVAFEGKKQKLGFLFDALYVKFSDNFDNQVFTTYFSTEGGFIEGAASYQPNSKQPLEVIAGLRYITADIELDLTPGPRANGSKSWLDPFIGLRYKHDIANKWAVSIRGDLGGAISADLVANANIMLAYKITTNTSLKLAYRYMNIDFVEDDFIFDAAVSGLGLGLGIKF